MELVCIYFLKQQKFDGYKTSSFHCMSWATSAYCVGGDQYHNTGEHHLCVHFHGDWLMPNHHQVVVVRNSLIPLALQLLRK
jgi:hypothetical protein